MFVIDDVRIRKQLNRSKTPDKSAVLEVLDKAKELKGLSESDIATLIDTNDDELISLMHKTARYVKDEIYGKRYGIKR